MKKYQLIIAACLMLVVTQSPRAQFSGFVNKGLVGVGRVPANSFDQLGANVDTLGGFFSAMAFDPASWSRSGNAVSGYTYSGFLYGLPDRGFGDGAQDYHPRIEKFLFSITPYYGSGPVGQTQLSVMNTNTLLLTNAGNLFTGFDANDSAVTAFPQSTSGSLGQGKRSLDPEGLVLRGSGGGYWVSDEYGPFIYRFDSAGVLQQTLVPPAALIPKTGAAFPRPNNFTANSAPSAGRFDNRGMEGLSITPDGKKLVAMLQSPTAQDGNSKNNSVNTRILIYNIEAGSPMQNQLVGEYVYVLTLNGQSGRNTPISEIYALNDRQFLIMERDALGLGTGVNAAPNYKKVNLADVSTATNIVGTGYDLEPGAPGALTLPQSNLNGTGITPAARQDFVDLLDITQLSKFGLNKNATADSNTISEKWEGLALIPLYDPSAPNDYLLLVGNDNDFKASTVVHNGAAVGSNAQTVDTMVLAYRVTLPNARRGSVKGADFDGDQQNDLSVWRPADGVWTIGQTFSSTRKVQQWGAAGLGDKLVPGDYDGDGKTDLAVFRPSEGNWYIIKSVDNTATIINWGGGGDIPVPGDFDGDSKTDVAVFRSSEGNWYISNSNGNTVTRRNWGTSTDKPVPGDYDGDGRTDVAVFRPSEGNWYVLRSLDGAVAMQGWGNSGDKLVPADYDGDGRTDFAVFRPAEGNWYIRRSSDNGVTLRNWGLSSDQLVPGYYDADLKADIAVWRPQDGVWYIIESTTGAVRIQYLGQSGDMAVPSALLPQ